MSRVGQGGYVDSTETGEYDYPEISYAYEVDDRRYVGHLLKRDDQYKTRSPRLVRRWLARYPVDAQVEVRWNPGNPAESHIYPQPIIPWLLPLLGGLTFALMDVAMFLNAFTLNPAYHRWNFLTVLIGAAILLLFRIMSRNSPR